MYRTPESRPASSQCDNDSRQITHCARATATDTAACRPQPQPLHKPFPSRFALEPNQATDFELQIITPCFRQIPCLRSGSHQIYFLPPAHPTLWSMITHRGAEHNATMDTERIPRTEPATLFPSMHAIRTPRRTTHPNALAVVIPSGTPPFGRSRRTSFLPPQTRQCSPLTPHDAQSGLPRWMQDCTPEN